MIERPEAADPQIVRAGSAEPVSDEEIRRAIATAREAAIEYPHRRLGTMRADDL